MKIRQKHRGKVGKRRHKSEYGHVRRHENVYDDSGKRAADNGTQASDDRILCHGVVGFFDVVIDAARHWRIIS